MRVQAIALLMVLVSGTAWAEDDHVPIMTIALEAQGESLAGQTAVGEVIRNRAREARSTFEEVCLKPYQFSCWNGLKSPLIASNRVSGEAYQRASRAWEASRTSNLTQGASHYLNTRLASPKWARQGHKRVVIGRHTFIRGVK